MAKVRYRSGAAAVVSDGVFEGALRNMLENYAPTVGREMESMVDGIKEGAKARWPVRTGRSQKALESYFDVTDSAVSGVVENDARDKQGRPYAFYIKSGKVGRTKAGNARRVWQVLVRGPLLKRRKKLLKDCAAEVAKLIER